MHIAIVGAGLAGLAAAWHLLQFPNVRVDIYDPAGPGGGASGMAAGLLHDRTGPKAKQPWEGGEGLAAAVRLIEAVSPFSSSPLVTSKGILRPALAPQQEALFQCALLEDNRLEWWSAQTAARANAPALPALYIPYGLSVAMPAYLEALGCACIALGARFFKQRISSLPTGYQVAIIAAGSATGSLVRLPQHTLLKGQILELEWPAGRPLPDYALSADCYIVPRPCRHTCLVGGTYERQFASVAPDAAEAERILRPKAAFLFPFLERAPLRGCQSGVRLAPPDKVTPLAGRLPGAGAYLFTGLGSKGLLYHAWLAELLAREVITGQPHLPAQAKSRL